ncbi:MAG: prenyltransferase, partial [Myxococcota bacterium]
MREDLPQKKIEVLSLEEPINKFYQRVEALPNREEIDILFVRGLEHSFYDYEERKRQEGWESKEIYSYSWKGVPPVL